LSTQELNRKRKFSQLEAGEKLAELNQRWHELVQKNIEITDACLRLSEEKKRENERAIAAALWDGDAVEMEE
jgi:predicted transcriptional regulator